MAELSIFGSVMGWKYYGDDRSIGSYDVAVINVIDFPRRLGERLSLPNGEVG